MSLQHAAKHLAAHGRGDDTVLVHMTRGELKSLNDLAMAGGGHLTINPHTGLHEAGFLRAMLPMIIGAGLAAATAGTSLAMTPAMTGLVVGGGYAAATGSVKKGLMAGLGAYGGAGMGSNLAASGTATGTAAAGTEAATAGEVAAEQARKQAMEDAARNAMDIRPPPPTVSPDVAAQSAREYASNMKGTTVDPFSVGTQKVLASNPISTGFNTATSSLQGAKDFVVANKNPLIATGVSALVNTDEKKPSETKTDADQGQRYNFQANPTAAATGAVPNPNIPSYEQMMSNPQNFGAEQRYFNPQYVNRAAGGPVEAMSNQAAMGANTMYPMANMATSSFATPYQSPVSTNMLAPTSDSGVTMNGEPSMQGTRMANGGISGSGNLDLSIPLDFGGGSGGGFGGAGANGYSAVGSGGGSQTGFTGQNNTAIGAKGGAGLSPLFNTGQTPFDNTFDSDTFQPQGTRAFGGNPQQMIGLLSSLMQGQQSGNASAQQPLQMASGGMATGGISDAGYNLGGYSDGGRLLRGPGDGVSDDIPAMIGEKQPARLADGEFVVPARIVSELGNGSTEAGARKLYAMMDRVQSARKKTVGKDKIAHNSRADKYLPA